MHAAAPPGADPAADALMAFRVDPEPVRRAGDAVLDILGEDTQHLFGFVRRLGLTDEQADDAVQEVLARLFEQAQAGVPILNPRAWAFRAIYRVAMDQHRVRRRLTALVASLGRRSETVADDDGTVRVAVWTEVDRLPERQRAVLYLRYRADLPFDEIGAALGISASAARSHAAQATATLRARLADTTEDPR